MKQEGKNRPFPVQYSTLSSEALKQRILSRYVFRHAIRCDYLYRGLNDNYVVIDADSKYILRVYRHNWRNLRDIETEMEILQYLRTNGVSVSFPISDRKGSLIQQIDAPEGLRYAVLFSYAKGEPPVAELTRNQSLHTGRELAKIHNLTVNMRLRNSRCHLDIISLLNESFYAVKPFIEDRRDDLAIFEDVTEKLKTKFESISLDGLPFGICHGDLYPGNYHFTGSDEVTIFDFDACCCNWFISDIAAYCYAVQSFKNAGEIINAFLEGYQETRKLSALEIELIPYFGAVSHIWVLATQCSNFEIFCHFVRTNIRRNIFRNLKKYVDKYCL